MTALDPLDAMLASLEGERRARQRRCAICDAGLREHVRKLREAGDTYEGIAGRLERFAGLTVNPGTVRNHLLRCRDDADADA